MMHKAWCNIEEVPYNFSGSSIKFWGHTGWKIDVSNPIWVRLLGRSQLSNPSDLPCSIPIQIQMKFNSALNQVAMKWLLKNFANVMTVVQSWHVQNFVTIPYNGVMLKPICHQILNYGGKIIHEIGPWYILYLFHAVLYAICHHVGPYIHNIIRLRCYVIKTIQSCHMIHNHGMQSDFTSQCTVSHYSYVTWASWHHTSLAIPLFVQQFV